MVSSTRDAMTLKALPSRPSSSDRLTLARAARSPSAMRVVTSVSERSGVLNRRLISKPAPTASTTATPPEIAHPHATLMRTSRPMAGPSESST